MTTTASTTDLDAMRAQLDRLMNVRRCQTGQRAAATQRKAEALEAEIMKLEAANKPEARPFSGGQPRCQICHRANHRPGEWQGHHFAYVTEAQVSEAAQREARITTTGGRTGKLTGYKDQKANPYVAFDDGSEYAIRLDAVREIHAAEVANPRPIRTGYWIWTSPTGVEHVFPEDRPCITCGKSHNYPAEGASPKTITDTPYGVFAVCANCDCEIFQRPDGTWDLKYQLSGQTMICDHNADGELDEQAYDARRAHTPR
jgi:hypothetical protein